jgi:hypothetical protein
MQSKITLSLATFRALVAKKCSQCPLRETCVPPDVRKLKRRTPKGKDKEHEDIDLKIYFASV